MKLLGIGGRSPKASPPTLQGKKRWQHHDRSEVEGSAPKSLESRVIDKRSDVSSSRDRPRQGSSDKRNEALNTQRRVKSHSIDAEKNRARSTSHAIPTRSRSRSRSRGRDIVSSSRAEAESRRPRQPLNKSAPVDFLRVSPELSLEVALERLHDYSTKNQSSRRRPSHRASSKKSPTPISTRTQSRHGVVASRGTKESAFTEWSSLGLRKNLEYEDTDRELTERVAIILGHQDILPASSDIGGQSSTLQSPNGGGLLRDEPTFRTFRLLDACLLCEAITAAPFICIQFLCSANDINNSNGKKSPRNLRKGISGPPVVINAIKKKDSVSMVTRSSYDSTGGFWGWRDVSEATRDQRSTPDSSEDFPRDEFTFEQEGARVDGHPGASHGHDQLEQVIKEQLMSTGKLDKELLKRLLDESLKASNAASTEPKSSETPVVSDIMSGHSGLSSSESSMIAVRPPKEGPLNGQEIGGIQSQANPMHLVMKSQCLPCTETSNNISRGLPSINNNFSRGPPSINNKLPLGQDFDHQYRSSPTSLRTPIPTQEKEVSQSQGTLASTSRRVDPPDNSSRERPAGDPTGRRSQEHEITDRSTPTLHKTAMTAQRNEVSQIQGKQQDLVTISPTLQRADISDSCSFRVPVTHHSLQESQEDAAHNPYARPHRSTPVSVRSRATARQPEALQPQGKPTNLPTLTHMELSNRFSNEVPVTDAASRQRLEYAIQNQRATLDRYSPISNGMNRSARPSRRKSIDLANTRPPARGMEPLDNGSRGIPTTNSVWGGRQEYGNRNQYSNPGRSTPSSRRKYPTDASTTTPTGNLDEWEVMEARLNGLLESGQIEDAWSATDEDSCSERAAASVR